MGGDWGGETSKRDKERKRSLSLCARVCERKRKRERKGGIKEKIERSEMAGGDGRRKGNPFADVCYEVHPPAHSSSPR